MSQRVILAVFGFPKSVPLIQGSESIRNTTPIPTQAKVGKMRHSSSDLLGTSRDPGGVVQTQGFAFFVRCEGTRRSRRSDHLSCMGKHKVCPAPSLLAHNNRMKRHEMHPGNYPGCSSFPERTKREIQTLATGRSSPLLATATTTSTYSRRVLQGFEPKTEVTLSASLTTQPPRPLASACAMVRRREERLDIICPHLLV